MSTDDPEVLVSKVANHKAGSLNWVGGRLTVTRDAIAFAPNGANAAALGDRHVEVPMRDVVGVSLKRGVVTDIVVVRGVHGEVQLRCWGARAVVRRLQELTGTS